MNTVVRQQGSRYCCYGNRQTLTSPPDGALRLMRIVYASFLSDTTRCPIVTSKSACRKTVGQTLQLLWEQTDFDFTAGRCLASDENSAC